MVLIDKPPRWAGSDAADEMTARAAVLLVVPVRTTIVDLEATVIGRLGSVFVHMNLS